MCIRDRPVRAGGAVNPHRCASLSFSSVCLRAVLLNLLTASGCLTITTHGDRLGAPAALHTVTLHPPMASAPRRAANGGTTQEYTCNSGHPHYQERAKAPYKHLEGACCQSCFAHGGQRITKRRSSWGCIGNPKPEQETIKGTHAQETPAYQRRPTTLHEGQGSNPSTRALYMQIAKIPHTYPTKPPATSATPCSPYFVSL